MKRFLIILFVLIGFVWVGGAFAEYELSPWKDSSGRLGTSERPWNTGNINTLTVNTAVTLPTTTKSFSLPLAGAVVEASNDIDEISTPDVTICDNVPCIVWESTGETGAVMWTMQLPSDFSNGLIFYALVSSNEATGAGNGLGWEIWENGDGIAFDAISMPQIGVTPVSVTLDTECEVLTLTADATAETAFTAGRFYTFGFFNDSTNNDDLELKGLSGTYTATR